MKLHELIQEQADNLRSGKEFAVVTIVESKHLARTSGKMIVYPDGSISGTVGGGMWEQSAISDGLQCIRDRKNAVRTYNFTTQMAEAGYQCIGEATVFIEYCSNDALQLIVVGGGHVGNAVIHAASTVGFHVTLVDTRTEKEIGDSIRTADRFIHVENFGDVEKADLPSGGYYVVSTYGHMVDGAALGGVLKRGDAAYIGMLGGRMKVRTIFAKLEQQGISREKLEAVHSPIGLDLGGETPEEIAIAVVGEILATKNGRKGGFLSGK